MTYRSDEERRHEHKVLSVSYQVRVLSSPSLVADELYHITSPLREGKTNQRHEVSHSLQFEFLRFEFHLRMKEVIEWSDERVRESSEDER